MDNTVRKIVKFESLPEEVRIAFDEQYPDGYKNIIFKVDAPKGAFYAFTFEHENVRYLVKVEFDIDNMFDGFEDEDEAIDDSGDGFIAAVDEIEDAEEIDE